MPVPLTSKKKAQTLSSILFLISLVALLFFGFWWPGIMLAVGIPLALRQFLLGRSYDAVISLLLFVGTFITVEFEISWQMFLPVLFTLGAIYVVFREFLSPDDTTEEEAEEELNHEIEEDKK
jgi:hypothetical protein